MLFIVLENHEGALECEFMTAHEYAERKEEFAEEDVMEKCLIDCSKIDTAPNHPTQMFFEALSNLSGGDECPRHFLEQMMLTAFRQGIIFGKRQSIKLAGSES